METIKIRFQILKVKLSTFISYSCPNFSKNKQANA